MLYKNLSFPFSHDIHINIHFDSRTSQIFTVKVLAKPLTVVHFNSTRENTGLIIVSALHTNHVLTGTHTLEGGATVGTL